MHEQRLKSQNSRKLLQWTAGIILTLSALLTCVPLNGQAEFNGYAFNPKAGICIGKDFQGFGAGLEFSLITNKSVWSFDVYLAENMSILGDSNAKFRQAEILFGKYIGTEHTRLQYQGGLAPTWGIKKGYYTDTGDYIEEESYMTFGLTGKLGLKLLVSHSVSFGVDLQGNLNLKNPMFFPSVSIEIGKLRERDGEL
jgi:hypothetical protein